MSNSKGPDVDHLAALFKALAHPNRLRIYLRLLACSKPEAGGPPGSAVCRCVGELGRDLGIVPSTVSHHIRELNLAGLIRLERMGKNVACWLQAGALERLSSFLAAASASGCSCAAAQAGARGRSRAIPAGKGRS